MWLLELDIDQDLNVQLRVRWIAGQPVLSLTDADFRGATGLIADQYRLIQQHGGLVTHGRTDDKKENEQGCVIL